MNYPLSTPFSDSKRTFSSPGCYDSYDFMGAHPVRKNGVCGWEFRVWAPTAAAVSVVGDFNHWKTDSHPMKREADELWSLFIPGLSQYDVYQYAIRTADGRLLKKSDPFAFHAETRPKVASKLYNLDDYQWGDEKWIAYRERNAHGNIPVNLYEVHLGSWRRTGDGQVLNYRTIAQYLVPYVKEMGYTGVKILPVGEHPLDESLGYQVTGYFAVTSRFGTPADFMYLVDQLHQAGVSVILDGVSTGFPRDEFGLYLFDGTPCFGIPDSAARSKTAIPLPSKTSRSKPAVPFRRNASAKAPSEQLEVCEFDCSKPQVQNFLISSAFFWMKKFHIDGIHFTGTPVENAGFISSMNRLLHQNFPYIITFAGEPQGVDGFDHGWNTEWVENMLERLTAPDNGHAGSIFAAAKKPSISCVLPLSHDLVAAPRLSLAARMLGDDNWKFAQVRTFYLFFLTQPGSKLTMMGTEFGQLDPWNCNQSLDWHLLQYSFYQKQQTFFREANNLYLSTPALWEKASEESFRILKNGEKDQIVAYVRQARDGSEYYILANFSGTGADHCYLELPESEHYHVIFSTDDFAYGGRGIVRCGELPIQKEETGTGVLLSLPPMSALVIQGEH
jgi:1,4-alpha-glucan branching enzyme